jgi:hypothetical protein
MSIDYHFAPSSNAALFDATMPATVFQIHTYIMARLQIAGWQIHKTDICNRLGLSLSTVKRAFRWLRDHRYAYYDKTTHWQFYPCPTDPVNQEGVKNEPPVQVNNAPPYKEVSLAKKEQQPAAPTPIIVEPVINPAVVVSSDELVYPEQLTPTQRKAAKHTLKKLKEPALAQEVLLVLAYALATGRIKCPPAYLSELVNRANSGLFEPLQAASATNRSRPIIPLWQGFGPSSPSRPDVAIGFIQQARAALRGALPAGSIGLA